MRFSVVIATKGRPEVLAETLESLRACDPPPAELLVVDGDEAGSAGPVVEAHRAAGGPPPAQYIQSPPGLPRQRNRGIDAATGDVLVFADDDVTFDAGIFAALEETYADPAVVGATARVLEPDRRHVGRATSRLHRLIPGRGVQGSMTRYGYPNRLVDLMTARDVEFVHGCLMSGRREVVASVRFDERLTGYALLEDEDFGYRLSRVGRVRYVPGAVVEHRNLGFLTTGTRRFNQMLVRNRAYLFRKNFAPTPAARAQFAVMMGILAAHRALNREWDGIVGLAEGAVQAWRNPL